MFMQRFQLARPTYQKDKTYNNKSSSPLHSSNPLNCIKVSTAMRFFLAGLLLLPLIAGDAITTTQSEKALKKAEDWY
ncbi:MAG: hypothetical protein BRD50_03900 [Bacteroidetes bacterium SW_11_45_7]|nr:MAG: hypothetical protein BRD50_03900 [Bacteroidetes bacterium SW_11_45_7]